MLHEMSVTSQAIDPNPRDLQVYNLRVLHGPNLFRLDSVIACDVRLGSLAHAPEPWLSGAYARIEAALSQMCTQPCSRRSDRTFHSCLKELREIPHIIEHASLALQAFAGATVSYGHVERSRDPDTWRLALEYQEELAGLESVALASRIVRACLAGQPFDLEHAVKRIQQSVAVTRPDPATAAVIREAKQRGIPVRRLGPPLLLQLGLGRNLRRVKGVLSDRTSAAAIEIARDHEVSRQILAAIGLPVPLAVPVTTVDQAIDLTSEIGYPIALKILPPAGEEARSLAYLENEEALRNVWPADDGCVHILVEGLAYGRDYSVLVVDGRVFSVVERISGSVQGDGRSAVRDLIRQAGGDARAEENANTHLTLSAQKYSLDSIPEAGQLVILPATNGSDNTCGPVVARSEDIHPENRKACELAAKTLGLTIAAVQLRSLDLAVPWADNGGRILRVDPTPNLSLHASVGDGPGRAVASHLIETLYPSATSATIPIVAVTGTNGKTTTTRLIAHLLAARYRTVGMRTTDGVYVGEHLLVQGDILSAVAGPLLLSNPEVHAAVIETGRGGILSHGLGFERTDVGVVLNVAADHLGLRGIHTLDDLARVKSVVIQAVKADGWAVLNADDPRVYAMRERTPGKVVVFTTDPQRVRRQVLRNIADDGVALFLHDSTYVLQRGDSRMPIAEVAEVPLALGGAAHFQHGNILAAIAVAYVLGVDLRAIRTGLASFTASPTMLPGRMNLIHVRGATVLVD